MNIDKDFNLMVGLRIREVREVLRMTREQFSERCDISDSFLAGERIFTPIMIVLFWMFAR